MTAEEAGGWGEYTAAGAGAGENSVDVYILVTRIQTERGGESPLSLIPSCPLSSPLHIPNFRGGIIFIRYIHQVREANPLMNDAILFKIVSKNAAPPTGIEEHLNSGLCEFSSSARVESAKNKTKQNIV